MNDLILAALVVLIPAIIYIYLYIKQGKGDE